MSNKTTLNGPRTPADWKKVRQAKKAKGAQVMGFLAAHKGETFELYQLRAQLAQLADSGVETER